MFTIGVPVHNQNHSVMTADPFGPTDTHTAENKKSPVAEPDFIDRVDRGPTKLQSGKIQQKQSGMQRPTKTNRRRNRLTGRARKDTSVFLLSAKYSVSKTNGDSKFLVHSQIIPPFKQWHPSLCSIVRKGAIDRVDKSPETKK